MLIDFQTLVADLVRDDSAVTDATDLDDAIALAVIRYSKDRPDPKVEDVVSAGGNYLDLPASWEANFSVLKSMEFPIGDVPPTYLESGAYGMYNHPSLGKRVMVRSSLGVDDVVRFTYSIQHVVSADTDTTSILDREAIAAWAASILCTQLASHYSGDSDSTIQADSVDHQNKSRDYSIRAASFKKQYHNALGIDPKRNVAAGVVVDLDMNNSRGGDRLTHGRRFR